MKKKRSGIDWLNHSISFLSALIGIFIAFQLEDWKDSRREHEELKSTLNAIRAEIENNMAVYRTNVEDLSSWLLYYQISTSSYRDHELRVDRQDFEKIKRTNPDWVKAWKQVDSSVNTLIFKVEGDLSINIDIAPKTGISKAVGRLVCFQEYSTKCLMLNLQS